MSTKGQGVSVDVRIKSVVIDANTIFVWAISGLENRLGLTFNHGVEGSSPSALTNKPGHYLHFMRLGRTRLGTPGTRWGHKMMTHACALLAF